MARSKARTVFYVLFLSVVVILIAAGSIAYWFSYHYKQIIREKLPEMVLRSSDSIYHISFADISVSLWHHDITLTDVKVWPDEKQAAFLRSQQRSVPPTLSTVSIPSLVATGIVWNDIISKKSLDCKYVTVTNLNWKMNCAPHPEDSLFAHDEKKSPTISKITSEKVDFINPELDYHYKGPKENFDCIMKGGTAVLQNFVYNYDHQKDTSLFLFARAGKVRFEHFVFSKPAGRYVIKRPEIDFETTENSVTLKSVKIKEMADNDQQTGKTKEVYDLDFPRIALTDFNWNRLIYDGVLRIPKGVATSPTINIRYIRENNPKNSRKGSYPNQLLLQVGLKTTIHEMEINNGHFKYTDVTPKGDEGIIEFTGIHGSFDNITNLPHAIAKRKDCIIRLAGKFMKKSDVAVTFVLPLTDSTGRYTVDGYVTNLDGDEVTPEAQVFTIVKVTSFHLNRMNMHIAGDETYGKGEFTVLYKDLKISLFKFDTKMREGKKGVLAFLGSALVLYPSNPMPNKDVRNVTTSFARDTTKGFIGGLWQHMFRAAKKTAVRDKGLVTLTDGPETNKGDKPKKGFFKRLFGKKNKA